MPKIALDLFHGTSNKGSTELPLTALPVISYAMRSNTDDLIYLGGDSPFTEFITNVDYVVEIDVQNEPVGTQVNLFFLGVLPGMFPIPVPISTEGDNKVVNITPLNEGKVQTNGKARFRVRFSISEHQNNQNGSFHYVASILASTPRGSAMTTFMRVFYNPNTLPAVGSTGLSFVENDRYLFLPIGTYGSWVDIFLGGGGGGGAGSRWTNNDAWPNHSATDGYDGGTVMLYLVDYNQMISDDILDLSGFGTDWNQDNLRAFRLITVGGGKGGRVATVTRQRLGSTYFYTTSEDHWGAGGVVSPTTAFTNPININGPWAKYLQLKVELIEYSDGNRGNAILTNQAGGAAAFTYPWGSASDNGRGGSGGDPTGENRWGYGGGGGSGAFAKIRISAQRKASAGNRPLPPLVFSFKPHKLTNYPDTEEQLKSSTFSGQGGEGSWSGGYGMHGCCGITARGWFSTTV